MLTRAAQQRYRCDCLLSCLTTNTADRLMEGNWYRPRNIAAKRADDAACAQRILLSAALAAFRRAWNALSAASLTSALCCSRTPSSSQYWRICCLARLRCCGISVDGPRRRWGYRSVRARDMASDAALLLSSPVRVAWRRMCFLHRMGRRKARIIDTS